MPYNETKPNDINSMSTLFEEPDITDIDHFFC